MTQTPYELLLKKEKERRTKLVNSIQSKDLKRRSASYNLKIINQNTNDPEGKPKEKPKQNFTNSVKKSYYFRKFLNRTSEGLITSEDFSKLKEKLTKTKSSNQAHDPHFTFFKQICQREHEKLLLKEEMENSPGLEIIIRSRETEKQLKELTLTPLVSKKSAEDKVENITDIAERRKLSIDFDLQIQGNKKYIRIKESSTSKSPNRKKNLQASEQTQEHPLADKEIELFPKCQDQNMRSPCTFFKRFQEQNAKPCEVPEDPLGMAVTRIKYNLGKTNQLASNDWNFIRSNTTEYKPQLFDFRTVDNTFQIRRQIRSSWNNTRENKLKPKQEAMERRYSIRQPKKRKLSGFNNDIEGWLVKNQQDEAQFFGQD